MTVVFHAHCGFLISKKKQLKKRLKKTVVWACLSETPRVRALMTQLSDGTARARPGGQNVFVSVSGNTTESGFAERYSNSSCLNTTEFCLCLGHAPPPYMLCSFFFGELRRLVEMAPRYPGLLGEYYR